MKGLILPRNEPKSVFAYLQPFKSAFDAYVVHKSTAMWLFNQNVTDTVKKAVKKLVKLSNAIHFCQKGTLKAYSAITRLLWKW